VLDIELTDNAGASLTVPFTVNVSDVNETPVQGEQLEPESSTAPFTVTLPENLFTDEDSDVLEYSVTNLDGSPPPQWLVFDAEALEINFSADAPADTNQSFIITADDGKGGVASTVVNFTIEPVIAAATPAPMPAPIPQIEVADSVLQVAELTSVPVPAVVETEEDSSEIQFVDTEELTEQAEIEAIDTNVLGIFDEVFMS